MERHLDSSALGLGDLADITVSNDETDSLTLSFDVSISCHLHFPPILHLFMLLCLALFYHLMNQLLL